MQTKGVGNMNNNEGMSNELVVFIVGVLIFIIGGLLGSQGLLMLGFSVLLVSGTVCLFVWSRSE